MSWRRVDVSEYERHAAGRKVFLRKREANGVIVTYRDGTMSKSQVDHHKARYWLAGPPLSKAEELAERTALGVVALAVASLVFWFVWRSV